MNPSAQNPFLGNSGSGAFEDTLRLIARLPAPEGLEERVQVGLHSAAGTVRGQASGRARILRWPAALSLENAWMRSAAAAAIVFVVAGGGWGVYSRVEPGQPARGIALPHVAAPGGFSGAGAMRMPQTLNGPVVGHPATAAPQPATAAAKGAARSARTPLHRGNSAVAKKAIAPPVAHPAR